MPEAIPGRCAVGPADHELAYVGVPYRQVNRCGGGAMRTCSRPVACQRFVDPQQWHETGVLTIVGATDGDKMR